MIAGECLLIVEEQERRLETWDYFHCPGGTDHIIVGAGHGPAIVVAVGARGRGIGGGTVYTVSELAARSRRERRARDDQLRRGVRRDLRGAAAVAVRPLRARIAARRRLTEPPAGYCLGMASPSAMLSQGQLALLAQHGEERRAEVGDILFKVGDRRYPLIAIIEGEAAILDAAGGEIIRHGPSGFLGESNLLSGQTVYLTAVVTQPMRYIAVEREAAEVAAVRGRAAQRSPALDVHRPPRGPAEPRRRRHGHHRAAVVRRDPADGRVRPPQPAARDLVGHEPR